MRLLRSSLSAAYSAALLCLATACHADEQPPGQTATELPELGLMGTIPIFWGETDNFSELLEGNGASHWARPLLEAHYRLRPLDELSEEALAGLDSLLLAQPRALSPAENVALDAWVRRGGRLLLFADPMMTGESRFALGDRRRPQDVILLSPILDHWGLALQFDADREPGYEAVQAGGAPIPVNLPGSLAAGQDSACEVTAGLLARCVIGEGRAVVLADAALLDLHEPHPAAAPALEWLIAESLGESGISRGRSPGSQD